MATSRSEDSFARIAVIVLGVIVLFPLLMMVFAMPMMGMMGWWWGGGLVGNGLSPLWGIGVMLVWLVVLVGIGYFLYRGVIGRVDSGRGTDPAIEELRIATLVGS